jgi:hypothetical protein
LERQIDSRLQSIRSHSRPEEAASEALESLRKAAVALDELSAERGIPVRSEQAMALIRWCAMKDTSNWRSRFFTALREEALNTPTE